MSGDGTTGYSGTSVLWASRIAIGVTVGLIVLFAGCGDGGGGSDLDPFDGSRVSPARRYGGTAVVGGGKDISTFNSLVSTDIVARDHQRFVLFATLVRLDENSAELPYLAESWDISPDSTLITFNLRDDLFWHDGRPTTARDVAFTFERAKDPDVPFPNVNDSSVFVQLRNAWLLIAYTWIPLSVVVCWNAWCLLRRTTKLLMMMLLSPREKKKKKKQTKSE